MNTRDLYKWRIAIGMRERTVWAEDPFSAAHKCGLGSGDLQRAEIELVGENLGEIDGGYRGIIGACGGFREEPPTAGEKP